MKERIEVLVNGENKSVENNNEENPTESLMESKNENSETKARIRRKGYDRIERSQRKYRTIEK